MQQPSLRIFTPIFSVNPPPRKPVYRVDDPLHSQWVRTVGLWGGALDGSLRIEGPIKELEDYFYDWLMYHVEERHGTKTWEGIIWSLTLHDHGEVLTRSMDEVYNAIRVRYKTPLENGGFETLATTWAHFSAP